MTSTTEECREWRDRATEAEGIVDMLGAMLERTQRLALQLQEDNDRWATVCDDMHTDVVQWRQIAHDVAAQRDEALALAAEFAP